MAGNRGDGVESAWRIVRGEQRGQVEVIVAAFMLLKKGLSTSHYAPPPTRTTDIGCLCVCVCVCSVACHISSGRGGVLVLTGTVVGAHVDAAQRQSTVITE